MYRIHAQEEWLSRAGRVMPAAGFGNYDMRAVIARGKGSRIWDEDGNEFVDFLIGSGPMLLGHGHPEVMEVVLEQLGRGTTFFANNARGIELAEVIAEAVPCVEQLRFVSTGTEADMYAMRLARAFTGRDRIVKFEGGYHGMSAEAQMSLSPRIEAPFPRPVPDSPGIPRAVAGDVLVAPFNDLAFAAALLEDHDDIAAIIVEPLQRIVPPAPGFLAGLRRLCDAHGVLLIFDEVVTGFRLAYGGAQERFGVAPDICTLGKVIGGGFPLAAFGARAEIMALLDRERAGDDRWLMQIGTLSGNPVAAAAGLKTLEVLRREGTYDRLRELGTTVQQMHARALTDAGIPHRISGEPALFDVLFTDAECLDYRSARHHDPARNALYNAVLRANSIFKSPGKTYPSLSLTEDDLALTRTAIRRAATALAETLEGTSGTASGKSG